MNVLIIGSGGRELLWPGRLPRAFHCDQLYVAPGNAGTDLFAENVELSMNDFLSIGEFVLENDIEWW